jgi:hypothetical protein
MTILVPLNSIVSKEFIDAKIVKFKKCYFSHGLSSFPAPSFVRRLIDPHWPLQRHVAVNVLPGMCVNEMEPLSEDFPW